MAESGSKYIPAYLRGRYQLLGTVTFAALFSVLFLLATIPFTDNAWFRLGNSTFSGFTSLFALGSLLIMIVSKVILYKTRLRFPLTYWQYVLWNLLEIILISLLYTGITISIAQPEGQGAAAIFAHALVYAFICLGVPYLIAGMFFTIMDLSSTIRLMNMQDVVTDEAPGDNSSVKKFTLFDNNGALKLSVSSTNLYYVESDDNYVKVWYADNKGALQTYILRARLKSVEETFAGSALIRCHRKFIVNMDHVKVFQKTSLGYVLSLDNESIPPIPVTKTYEEQVLAHFQQ